MANSQQQILPIHSIFGYPARPTGRVSYSPLPGAAVDSGVGVGDNKYSIPTKEESPLKPTAKSQKPKANSQKPKPKTQQTTDNRQQTTANSQQPLREDYPFLSSPTCPPQLKILAANKITAYRNYTAAHKQLFDCTTPQQQFDTVQQLVENFIENRDIFKEFDYFKQHGTILGEHRVFKEYEELQQLARMSDVALYKKAEQLKQNIWRIKSEIDKDDKPHLKPEREKRILQKQTLLQEVIRLMSS
ncbi:MAG: hypothetical protein ABJG41_01390 [Cyclobacteriaceae bacterium]